MDQELVQYLDGRFHYLDERFEIFLEWLDAYRSHLQSTEPHIEKRHQLLRDAVSKVKLQAKIEFPKVEKKADAPPK